MTEDGEEVKEGRGKPNKIGSVEEEFHLATTCV